MHKFYNISLKNLKAVCHFGGGHSFVTEIPTVPLGFCFVILGVRA